ncbi:MAG: hypothetical protein WA373_14700 [Burkholderiales bacterium]
MNSGQASDKEQDQESGRGRSTIEFPYLDLDDAIAVAQAVHAVGGTSCDWDQLAAKMGQQARGGGFRMRVMTSRVFGLLNYDRGTVTLSDLGIHIVDPKFARGARAESFLAVPLFKAMYEKLKGGMLPPVAAIERQMEAAGVAPKQKDKARQVFIRSAKQAGFFELDQNRLTYPPNIGAAPVGSKPAEEKPAGGGTGSGGTGTGSGRGDELHPFIKGLLEKLPVPESEWSIQARSKWLQTASNIFDLMYKAEPDDNLKIIEIKVTGI